MVRWKTTVRLERHDDKGKNILHSFVTPAQAGVGLYSASETSQQPTVGQGIIKDPIPAFAGMTMGESKVIKTLSSWGQAPE